MCFHESAIGLAFAILEALRKATIDKWILNSH